ncbi:alpha/beta fold hydrolase [Marinobacter caseinilyticus]|uniref:alpha/beta fold hydrolase n=1 Tax=Marinobacter caseinilyticus TaxID=2692195 RepID=UPI00140C9D8F|nr:alpha/beta fold hydrolase [Marinobacter caseinilyticus]
MSVELNSRVMGEGPPLILLHGLFGSLENLGGVAQRLQDQWQIHALDLRNHGRSPHTDTMDYTAMADDVIAYMDRQGLDRAAILGHSMGGKTAMEVALANPGRVDHLIVADIAPVAYKPRHDAILEGMTQLDLTQVQSRTDADRKLSDKVEALGVRQFLLKNLVKVSDEERHQYGQTAFRWRLNLPVIEASYSNLTAAPSAAGPFEGPTLFIKGADSAYIQDKHREAVTHLFPSAELRVIQGTGHWLHAEKADTFATLCRRFLEAPADE